MTSSIPTDLSAALAARYDLRAVLGRGGMATVYLAQDRKHHREVAIKVLRPEIATSLGSERFLAEIQIVARMVHPHVLAMHESGDADGFVYYVMPYIEGGSLRQRLDAEQLGATGALAIAAPVADALGYAHRLGVLHRDIKPENILFAQTHPIVADFGIAKALSSASGPHLTRTGISIGTPGYMSPEQAAGFSDVDERTDVYSLAVVVYEMIVGQIPGRWPSEDAVHAGRFLEAPQSHRARLAAAGGVIEGALVRGLAVRPDYRTVSPAVLMDELRGTASPKSRRRYLPEEIDEIVKRASELEVSTPTESGAMTIGGVERLAADVGIPVEHVRSAVASMTPRPSGLATPLEPPKVNKFLNAPTRLLYERIIDGELDQRDFPVVVEEIRRVMENVGQVSQLGQSFSWSMVRSGSPRRDLEVSVNVRSGKTRITVHENLNQLVGQVFGGIGGGLGGGGMGPMMALMFEGLHAAPWGFAVMIPAWLLTVFSVARATYYHMATRRQKTLEGLMERLVSLTEELLRPRLPGT
jgi:serine/threonine protein kinase